MRKVESSIAISCKPEQVIAAFLAQQHLHKWWGVERSLIEKRINGTYALAWEISESGIKYLWTGLISSYDPRCELIVSNLVYCNPNRPMLGPMKLDLKADKLQSNHCKLTLIQSGYQTGEHWDWYYEAVVHAWPAVLGELKKYLERWVVGS